MLFLLCTRKFVYTNEDCIQLRIPNLYIWRCLVQAVALITVHTVRWADCQLTGNENHCLMTFIVLWLDTFVVLFMSSIHVLLAIEKLWSIPKLWSNITHWTFNWIITFFIFTANFPQKMCLTLNWKSEHQHKSHSIECMSECQSRSRPSYCSDTLSAVSAPVASSEVYFPNEQQ